MVDDRDAQDEEPAGAERADATDGEEGVEEGVEEGGDVHGDAPVEPWERPIDKFRRSSAGTVIAAGLLGVRDALEGRPEKEEPAIVADAPEPTLDHIDIVLDPEHPERSRAIVYLPPRDDA